MPSKNKKKKKNKEHEKIKTPSVNAIHILSDVFGIDFLWTGWSTHISIFIRRVHHEDLSVKSNHQVPQPSSQASSNNAVPIQKKEAFIEWPKQNEQLHKVPPPSSSNNKAPIKKTLKQKEQLKQVVENKKHTRAEEPKNKNKNKSKQHAYFPVQAPKKASQFVRIKPSTRHAFALERITNPIVRAWLRKKQADRKKILEKQAQRNQKISKAITQHHAFVPNEKQMAREKWQMHRRKNKIRKRKTRKQRREERKHMKKWSFENELIKAEPGETFVRVDEMLGQRYLKATRFDTGEQVLCHIPGQMRDKVRVYRRDVLLVSLRSFQFQQSNCYDRCDVLVKYSWEQVKQLYKMKCIRQIEKVYDDVDWQIDILFTTHAERWTTM